MWINIADIFVPFFPGNPLGQFELRLEQVCSFQSFFAGQNLVLVFLNLKRKFEHKRQLRMFPVF